MGLAFGALTGSSKTFVMTQAEMKYFKTIYSECSKIICYFITIQLNKNVKFKNVIHLCVSINIDIISANK